MLDSHTMSSRREREREEMRQRITDAARDLFITRGFEHVTIRAIADAIEYTPGSIYSYFKDKDAIFSALHTEGFGELQRSFAKVFEEPGTPIDYLRRIGRAYLEFAKQNPQMYDLMFVCEEPMDHVEKHQPWVEGSRAYDQLRALVRVAIDGGWLRKGDPEVVAFMMWSACHGMVTLEYRCRTIVVPEGSRSTVLVNSFEYLIDSLAIR
jgi:AcrR family transcriptional regulator